MVSTVRVHTEPRAARPLVLVLVALGVLASVLAGLTLGFRAAGYGLAAVLAAAALARLLLPVRVVGALAIRSRGLDLVTMGTFAAALAVLARTAPG